MDSARFYDRRYAGDYMDTDAYSVWRGSDSHTRMVLETLARVRERPRRILDYGCGVGGWVDFLSRVYPGAEISGVDVSQTAVEKARGKFPDFRFESLDGLTAPFTDAAFDLVFTYHVLEHVDSIETSIGDIARMLRVGGYAVVIFPCGNAGSFLDRVMRLMKDSRVPTKDGRTVLFFETTDGHVRRMTSRETEQLFAASGLECVGRYFSGHFFGTVDWLCRGTGPAYINAVFAGRPPVGPSAKRRLETARRIALLTHRLVSRKSLDLARKSGPVDGAFRAMKKGLGILADRMLVGLGALEWRLCKRRPSGTAQYLVFHKVR